MAIDFPASPNTGDHHTDGTNTWKWNGTYWARTKVTTKFTPSDTAPSDPTRMDLWYETDSGKLFVRHDASWVEVGHASDAQTFQVSDTAPSTGTEGDIWFESDTGRTFMYYTDSNSSQWIEVGHASDFGNDSARNIDGGTSSTNYGGLLTLDGGSSV